MTIYTCQLGWHVVRDFLRLWSRDGSGSMFARFNGRLGDQHRTCVYQVAPEPLETEARRVWAYEDQGRSWVCIVCGKELATTTSGRRPD